MRFTSSYAVFRFGPGEKVLAKARWLSREGKAAAAEQEYRAALASDPDLRSAWLELFELLRQCRRYADALELAQRAELHFGPDAAMPLAIRGAALAELGRTREAVEALEAAIERDGNLALAWHELAYAAFRAGEYSRALLVLDRAFSLEPHTDTLLLRGRILREAGQYDAAEVAFEGAHQSAEHDLPRREAAWEILATRRAAALGRKRPRDFTVRERAFAELGCVLLDGGSGALSLADQGPAVELLAGCLGALARLVGAMRWPSTACCAVAPEDRSLAEAVGRATGIAVLPVATVDAGDRPLLVAVHADGEEWQKQLARLDRWRSGYAFALTQPPETLEPADIVGTLRWPFDAAATRALAVRALAGFEAGPPDEAGDDEIVTLTRHPLARWRTRSQPADLL
jgi:tetratricopeptide (TPR) repeat protein